MKHLITLFVLLSFLSVDVTAQWNNRYPKVDGYGHHVYLEAFELPVLNSGTTDPAPSPDGKQLAFAAKGWLFVMNLETGVAKQITSSGPVDARPNWSPDGNALVFSRDDGSDTWIMHINLTTGEERILANSDKMELDPIFSENGKQVLYASAANGSFDLWQVDLATDEKKPVTTARSLERQPVPSGEGEFMLYLKKQGFSYDNIEIHHLASNKIDTLVADNFVSQAAFTLAPDQRTIAYSWADIDNYEIRLIDLYRPAVPVRLMKSRGLPLTPKFSADGEWIYYTEFNQDERAEIKRIHVGGGTVETIEVKQWEWAQPMHTIQLNSLMGDVLTPVRLHAVDANGHPVIPETTIVHSEGQNGLVFFYSPGEIQLTVPVGKLTITAVHGFETTPRQMEIDVTEKLAGADILLEQIWDANGNGWYAGDNHFHLNYGGPNQLDPEDLVLELKGEGMDVAFPLVANLHNRYLDENLFGWSTNKAPFIQFGQEVRSHFLGHLNLIGTNDLFWPWIWGPRYDVYGRDDRTNAEAVNFAREHGGLAGYVHPVGVSDPFTENGRGSVPVELVADCVLGECDMIEVGCLWTDEIGTGALWHEFLNLGIPVALSAGSDVMTDYYRTMAIGATRLYVKPDGDLSIVSYLSAMKQGRSFVSNGPQVLLEVAGQLPGGVVTTDDKKVDWTLEVHTPVAFEKIEIFVNGQVVWSKDWKGGPGSKSFKGSISVPEGGWVTARASGGTSTWPMMDSYPFAETGPVWFKKRGSTANVSRVEAAKKLRDVLDTSFRRLRAGYGDAPIPNLEAQFERALQKLNTEISSGSAE